MILAEGALLVDDIHDQHEPEIVEITIDDNSVQLRRSDVKRLITALVESLDD